MGKIKLEVITNDEMKSLKGGAGYWHWDSIRNEWVWVENTR